MAFAVLTHDRTRSYVRDHSRLLSQRGVSELSHANRRLKEAERRCQELEFLLKSESLG